MVEMRSEGWIGYTLRKPASTITRQALTWNPQGKRGRPRNTWRKGLLTDTKRRGYSWRELERTMDERSMRESTNQFISGVGSV